MSKITGADRMAEVLQEAILSIEQQFTSGKTQATYLLTQRRIGSRHRMDVFGNWLCRELEQSGYRVLGATESGWDYRSVITVDRR